MSDLKLPVVAEVSIISGEVETVRELKARTAKLLNEPMLLDVICSYVSSGGSLTHLCETWSVRYGDVCNWIHQDAERDRRYCAALNDRSEWGTDKILSELRCVGLTDIREIFDEAGNVKPPGEWPIHLARAVASIEVFEEFQGSGKNREYLGQTKKLKFWDKNKALELLGKNMGLFTDRIKHEGTVKLEDLILGSFKEEDRNKNS